MFFNAPHFDLPFRFAGSSTVTVEQDTEDDVYNCVLASLMTELGFRPALPNYGTPELTFGNQPLPLDALIQKITHDEPRAAILFSQNPNLVDNLIADVTLLVSTTSGGQ
jgi:hypothetical protein